MIIYYTDINVHGAIISGSQRRGINVLKAQDDGYDGRPDNEVIDRATELGYILFSHDKDMLREATQRLHEGVIFSGVVYAGQQNATLSECIDGLEYLAQAGLPEDFRNRVYYLPL